MKLLSLTVSNIGPFRGEQHVNFGTGLISIEGRYIDKPGESNRAGKTALIDLIRFALYGQHRHRNVVSYLNRKADSRNDPVFVALELDMGDNRSLHIIREFDHSKQAFNIRIPEIDETYNQKQAEIQQYIENQILNCSYDNALRTWLVLQNDAKGIMDLSVSDRKKFLLDLFAPHQYHWDAYYSEANARLSTVKARQSIILSRINGLSNRLTELDGLNFEQQIKMKRKEILNAQERRDHLRDSLKDLEALASPEAIERLRATLKEEKQREVNLHNSLLLSQKLKDKLTRDMRSLKSKEEALSVLQNTQKKLQAKLDKTDYARVEAEYTQIYNKHRDQSALLNQNMTLFTQLRKFKGICPVTKQECTTGADISAYRKELEAEISKQTQAVDNLQIRLDDLVVQIDTFDAVKRDLLAVESNIRATEIALEHLQGAAEAYEEHQVKLRQETMDYDEQKKKVAKIEAELKARTLDFDLTYNRRIREIKQEQDTLATLIAQLQKDLELLVADQQRKSTLELDFADAKKEMDSLETRAQALKALKPMLSPSGVPFYDLLASVNDFESSINRALAELGTDLTIFVEPYTRMSTYVPICPICGYEFPKGSGITKCMNPLCGVPREKNMKETLEMRLRGRVFDVNFDEDSGGGQQWVSLGVRFALFNILKERQLMGDIGFWSLDEVFAPLSEAAKFNMLSKLDGVLDSYGIEQLFLITHTDISAAVPPSIIIERSDALQESYIRS